MLEEIQIPFSNEQTWFVTYGRLADPIGAIGLRCDANWRCHMVASCNYYRVQGLPPYPETAHSCTSSSSTS
jgi:hypothetical protein